MLEILMQGAPVIEGSYSYERMEGTPIDTPLIWKC